eukprot:jgi/Mesvir1/1198/Mv17690-RA.1
MALAASLRAIGSRVISRQAPAVLRTRAPAACSSRRFATLAAQEEKLDEFDEYIIKTLEEKESQLDQLLEARKTMKFPRDPNNRAELKAYVDQLEAVRKRAGIKTREEAFAEAREDLRATLPDVRTFLNETHRVSVSLELSSQDDPLHAKTLDALSKVEAKLGGPLLFKDKGGLKELDAAVAVIEKEAEAALASSLNLPNATRAQLEAALAKKEEEARIDHMRDVVIGARNAALNAMVEAKRKYNIGEHFDVNTIDVTKLSADPPNF